MPSMSPNQACLPSEGEYQKYLMQIDVLPATQDQQSILENLLELYSHAFSEFVEVKLGARRPLWLSAAALVLARDASPPLSD